MFGFFMRHMYFLIEGMLWTWISQTHGFNIWYIDTNAKCNFIKHCDGVSIKDTFSFLFTLFKQVFMILRYIKDIIVQYNIFEWT